MVQDLNSTEKNISARDEYYYIIKNKQKSKKEKTDAFNNLKDFADNGDDLACFYIGSCYEEGIVCKKSLKDAESYYQMSYESSNDDTSQKGATGLCRLCIKNKNFVDAEQYLMTSHSSELAMDLGEFYAKKNTQTAYKFYDYAAQYGDVSGYKKAFLLAMEKDSTWEDGIEYASKYIKSGADPESKQEVADQLIYKFLSVQKNLNKKETEEKRQRIEMAMEQFMELLKNHDISIADEKLINKLKDRMVEWGKPIGVIASLISIVAAIAHVGKDKK